MIAVTIRILRHQEKCACALAPHHAVFHIVPLLHGSMHIGHDAGLRDLFTRKEKTLDLEKRLANSVHEVICGHHTRGCCHCSVQFEVLGGGLTQGVAQSSQPWGIVLSH